MNNKVIIIIPHYGRDDVLFRLLRSLHVVLPSSETIMNQQIVISTEFGGIYIFNNNYKNLGFTRACNEGIRYGLEHDFKIFWLLNNDTIVPDIHKAISDFEMELNHNLSTGVIGCKMLSIDNPDMIHHAGTTAAMPSGIHKQGFVSKGEYNLRTLEKWVTGASLVISRKCVVETGLLDEHLFNYASDSDYCYRARLAGMDVVYLPTPILHQIGQSSNPSPEQLQILKEDVDYFKDKWINGNLFEKLDSEV